MLQKKRNRWINELIKQLKNLGVDAFTTERRKYGKVGHNGALFTFFVTAILICVQLTKT